MPYNVPQLAEVADFQHQAIANIDKILIKQIPFKKITKPAISANCC